MHFFTKLIASRPTFAQDMSPEEREIMNQHIVYWKGLMAQGKVVVFGPVMDPAGAYGMGVISVADEAEASDLTSKDPATAILRHEIYPMRAVLPD
jgi:hypothetical protein